MDPEQKEIIRKWLKHQYENTLAQFETLFKIIELEEEKSKSFQASCVAAQDENRRLKELRNGG